MTEICVHAFVSGKVQGVWFRQSTKEQALRHSVTGWAKNLPDGRVEVMLCGEQAAVVEVQAWLLKGPQLARVINVAAQACDYETIVGFETC